MYYLITRKIKKNIMNIFWISLSKKFIIINNDFEKIDSLISCEFIPITSENYHLVYDFRENDRIVEYKNKLKNGEIGFFVKHKQKAIGSIWATINNNRISIVVRNIIDLKKNEALIHDVVVSEKFRGNSIGPFMVSEIIIKLFQDYKIDRVIIDANIMNKSSLKMMKKLGLRLESIIFCVSLLNKRILNLKFPIKKHLI